MTEAGAQPARAVPPGGAVEVRVPGDKSISHRALLLAALADGTSRLRGLLDAGDTRSTAEALRRLGVPVPELPPDGAEILVHGAGLRGLKAEGERLDCGNSGTTARLLAGALAGSDARVVLDGDPSLRARPMDRVVLPLRRMGARIDPQRPGAARLPLAIRGGALTAIDYASPVASAQVKSALLLAGVVGRIPVRVEEPRPSRDHTERMLAAMGARIRREEGGRAPAVSFEPGGTLEPLDLDVPADPSSAAYFAALAALLPRGAVRLVGVSANPTRVAFFGALERMGAAVAWRDVADGWGGEPVGAVEVAPERLRGIAVGADEVPAMIDELPLLAVLASRAEGESRVSGAAELRVKESDRIAATVSALRSIGADAEELPDGFVVRGGEQPLRGRVETRGDHRMAMAFGVLTALPGNRIEIDDPNAADVSFPAFWRELRRVRLGCLGR